MLGLTLIFIIESFAEIRLYGAVRRALMGPGQVQPSKRVARIIKIENQWSWVSWIFLLLLFVVPAVYNFLLICIITLIETWVVYELQNAKNDIDSANRR